MKKVELVQNACAVSANGRTSHLTPKEYGILSYLMNHPDRTHSAEEIYASVWNETPYACKPIISVHVRHIREKIETDPSRPAHIVMLWGQGYRYFA